MGRVFVGLVLFLVACGGGESALQFENTEGRTAAQVESEMSCGCPAGHTLACVSPGGELSHVADACESVPFGVSGDEVPTGFSLYYAWSVIDSTDCDHVVIAGDPQGNEQRLLDSLFCVPN